MYYQGFLNVCNYIGRNNSTVVNSPNMAEHSKTQCFLFFSLFCILSISCSHVDNYKEAYGYEANGQSFIKLKGKRQVMSHDPASFLSKEKYEDSLILKVPSLADGRINGNDIPVQPGYYKYLGD